MAVMVGRKGLSLFVSVGAALCFLGVEMLSLSLPDSQVGQGGTLLEEEAI